MEFVFNPSGQRVSEWDGTTHNLDQGRYLWGSTPVAFYAGGTTHFDHQDWLGTERARTTYNGGVDGTFTSLPFGDGQTSSGQDWDAYHYAQLDHDSAPDTDHAQFRQYSNALGRWLSSDPYGGSYDPTNPQSFNRYAYVLSNPLALVDPLGLNYGHPGSCNAANSCAGGTGNDPSFSFSPGGNGSGLTGLMTITVPTATWVPGREVPGGPYQDGYWVYGSTYATIAFGGPSSSGPPQSGAAPNNPTPKNGPDDLGIYGHCDNPNQCTVVCTGGGVCVYQNKPLTKADKCSLLVGYSLGLSLVGVPQIGEFLGLGSRAASTVIGWLGVGGAVGGVACM